MVIAMKAKDMQVYESVPLSSMLDGIVLISPELDCNIHHISIDHRTVGPGSLFIAYPGATVDARRFIPDAIAKGASAILYDQNTPLSDEALAAIQDDQHRTTCVGFHFQRALIGQIAAKFYQEPTAQLDATAVTGSNGKTSVAYMVAMAMAYLGQKCGFMGTIGSGIAGDVLENTGMTTPNAVEFQRNCAHFLHKGAQNVVFEASSHGIEGERLAGSYIDTAVFTNFKADHLDFHGTEDAYFEAKAALFSRPELQHAVVNMADPKGAVLKSRLAKTVRVLYYQVQDKPEEIRDTLVGSGVVLSREGLSFDVTSPWGKGRIISPLWGAFQAHNLLAAMGVLLLKGIAFADAIRALSCIENIPGRMQVFGGKGQPLVVIDYAHNEDGLAHALQSLRALSPRKLWCVFGCGGERDHARRSGMGKVAELHSDQLIVTNDNPRSEAPERITNDILAGLVCPWAATVEHDRNRAITQAIEQASADDIVLIAGKGHETTMEVLGEKVPHSDEERVRFILGLKGAR